MTNRYWKSGLTWGFIIGLILDVCLLFRYNMDCQYSKIQQIVGITPYCERIYFLFFWFAIIGGIIGYFIKKKN